MPARVILASHRWPLLTSLSLLGQGQGQEQGQAIRPERDVSPFLRRPCWRTNAEGVALSCGTLGHNLKSDPILGQAAVSSELLGTEQPAPSSLRP